MPVVCPSLCKTLVITDDATLAARASCALARAGTYTPIMDEPRLERPDRLEELRRRNNAAGRVDPDSIILAGISDEAHDAIVHGFNPGLRDRLHRAANASEIKVLLHDSSPLRAPPLAWGRDRIGVGLLKALRAGSDISFSDRPSPTESVASRSGHLVVCEDGNELAQVIAANYAFALGAGLQLVPAIDDSLAEDILERLYNVPDISSELKLEELKRLLRDLCGAIAVPASGSLTFVTRQLPYGFAFPEVPSTHLFSDPDLGIAIINGLAAEQEDALGVGVAALVDPGTTNGRDIAAAKKLLPSRGMLLRLYEGRGATVRAIAEMLELLPYDLLLIATHCGEAYGERQTYKFSDSEGIDRTLVVDVATSFGVPDSDLVEVREFMNIVSLDGMDWRDPAARERCGSAIADFVKRTASDAKHPLKPTKTENVLRVRGSATLEMSDDDYISLPHALACHGTPIIINNACYTWHHLAADYTFGNARAYIGTLFPVTSDEAEKLIVSLFGKQFGRPLAVALWSAQREMYGDNVRWPYVVTGIFPQGLRPMRRDVPHYVARRLSSALRRWKGYIPKLRNGDERSKKRVEDVIAYYERELDRLRERWPNVGC